MTGYRLMKPSEFAEQRVGHGHSWGSWVLDAERLCLCRVRDGGKDPMEAVYEIDLEEITNAFWLVDWLEHISVKTWATPEVMGHLTKAMIDLFHPRSDMVPSPNPAGDPLEILKVTVDRIWDRSE